MSVGDRYCNSALKKDKEMLKKHMMKIMEINIGESIVFRLLEYLLLQENIPNIQEVLDIMYMWMDIMKDGADMKETKMIYKNALNAQNLIQHIMSQSLGNKFFFSYRFM